MSFHCFPKEPERRALWLGIFELDERDVKDENTHVCLRHFPDRDSSKPPSLTLGKLNNILDTYHVVVHELCTTLPLGKRLASPIKPGPRAKRAKERNEKRVTQKNDGFSLTHPLLVNL